MVAGAVLPKFNFGLRLCFNSTSGWYIVLPVREVTSAVVHVGLQNLLSQDDVALLMKPFRTHQNTSF